MESVKDGEGARDERKAHFAGDDEGIERQDTLSISEVGYSIVGVVVGTSLCALVGTSHLR